MRQITPQMIEAGEAVLDRACVQAELPPSWILMSAVRDVYNAMETARLSQGTSNDAGYAMDDAEFRRLCMAASPKPGSLPLIDERIRLILEASPAETGIIPFDEQSTRD